MRFMFIMRKMVPTFITATLVFGLTGCSSLEMQKVTVRNSDAYEFSLQKEGFRISVDPYKEKDRLQANFGCNLLSRGVLPVLVVIENQSAEDGYVLMLEKVNLVLKEASATGQGAPGTRGRSQADELQKAGKGVRVTSGFLAASPIFGILGVAVALPFEIVADKKYSDETEIKRNLEEKQMVTKTLYQGSSQNGFFYFNLGKDITIDRVQGIDLSLKNIRTDQVVSFIIKIEKM
jgi:hypothetical protein